MKTINKSFALIVFVLLAGTTSLFAQKNDLIGSWSKQEGNVWKFTKDNTYKITAGPIEIEGTYTIKENEITLIDKTAKGVKFTCKQNQKGVYKYVVTNGTLRVLSVADSCGARRASIPGMYKKL